MPGKEEMRVSESEKENQQPLAKVAHTLHTSFQQDKADVDREIPVGLSIPSPVQLPPGWSTSTQRTDR